jgi:hypothetical protein
MLFYFGFLHLYFLWSHAIISPCLPIVVSALPFGLKCSLLTFDCSAMKKPLSVDFLFGVGLCF